MFYRKKERERQWQQCWRCLLPYRPRSGRWLLRRKRRERKLRWNNQGKMRSQQGNTKKRPVKMESREMPKKRARGLKARRERMLAKKTCRKMRWRSRLSDRKEKKKKRLPRRVTGQKTGSLMVHCLKPGKDREEPPRRKAAAGNFQRMQKIL